MFSLFKKIFFTTATIIFLYSTVPVHADSTGVGSGTMTTRPGTTESGGASGINSTTGRPAPAEGEGAAGTDNTSGRPNPNFLEGTALDIPTEDADLLHMVAPFLLRIINVLFAIAGFIAVLAIISGGYKMITAAGNDEQIKSGTKALTQAIIGLILVLAAALIMQTIESLLGLDIPSA